MFICKFVVTNIHTDIIFKNVVITYLHIYIFLFINVFKIKTNEPYS